MPRRKLNVMLGLLILLLVALGPGCDRKYDAWGVVRELHGPGIPGVEMVFSGEGRINSVTTNSRGEWSKSKLKGPVMVTPRKTGYTFTPRSAMLPASGGVSFSATYTVSGVVVDAGTHRVGIEGVRLHLGSTGGFIVTDEQGRWRISGLTGTETITPHHAEYVFHPSSLKVTNPSSSTTLIAEKKQKRIYLREIEPNNEWDWANIISLDEIYYGHIETADDIDFYKFTLSAPGSIVIQFDHAPFDNDHEYWRLTLFDGIEALSEVDDIYSFASHGDEANINSPVIRLPAGDYYIRVAPYEFMDTDYRLCVLYCQEGELFEKEFNDTLSTATPIRTDTKYTGNLYRHEDIDYYRFTLPTPGSIMVQFSHTFFDDCHEYWRIALLDEGGTASIYSLASRGSEEDTNSPTIRLPAGDYYIKIAPDSDYFHHMDYDLCVSYTEEGESFEKEFNDTLSTATPIETDTQYTGNLYQREDVDYYGFTLHEPGSVVIRFSHAPFDDSRDCWRVALLDEAGTVPIYCLASRGGEENANSPAIRLPAGGYYIRVTAETFCFHHIDYDLSVLYSEEGEAFEKEFNDTFATATPIEIDVKYTGNLHRRSDMDYYRFTLYEPGSIVVEFSHVFFDDNREFWHVALLDEAGTDLIYSFASRGKEEDTSSPEIPLTEGDYYVRITPHPYYFHYMDYAIRIYIPE